VLSASVSDLMVCNVGLTFSGIMGVGSISVFRYDIRSTTQIGFCISILRLQRYI
jgi:hypothetical protein